MRAWLIAVFIGLAFAAGLAVDYWMFNPGRAREAGERALREFARREGEVADLRRRLQEAERRAQMEAEQRRIAEEVIRREKLWK